LVFINDEGLKRAKVNAFFVDRRTFALIMRATFLGTGTSQGVPVITCRCAVCTSEDPRDQRLRTSVLLSTEDAHVVIDTGPDFRQQMLRGKVPRLDAVVFTHEHKDHIAGLDDIRAYNYSQKQKIPVYCTERVEGALRREFAYAFEEPEYPGIPEIELVRISEGPFQVASIELMPIAVMHQRMPVLGYRWGGFTYITDANFISEEEKSKIYGSEILVLNALRHDVHPSHYNLEQALRLVEEIQPERAYFTHISHQLGMHREVEATLPTNVFLAYDGLTLELS
jgi:phosphoribosyl 1,2-cyclic phosphate phosphodiesterase